MKNFALKFPVSITSIASVSALGSTPGDVWDSYKQDRHFLLKKDFQGDEAFAAFISPAVKRDLEAIRKGNSHFEEVDDSVVYAIYAARKAVEQAGWKTGCNAGINIGSSRGATSLFENHYLNFIKSGRAETLASPSTTLGNISSWVAQDLQSIGPDISHSVTCSTGLHAVLNGVAWIGSGMTEKFLAGGSEAPLTPFTIAQVQAMKINSRREGEYPCQALNLEKKENSMVLGEGSAVACMEAGIKENAIVMISGVGYATEKLEHPVSISANGSAFQKAMTMAMGDISPGEVDAVVMHAPGTIKGDLSEVNALKAVFKGQLPAMTTNKWKLGHTFGASGVLSLELAAMMLHHQQFVPVPFVPGTKVPKRLKNILINAVGFGGNAVSILVSLPE